LKLAQCELVIIVKLWVSYSTGHPLYQMLGWLDTKDIQGSPAMSVDIVHLILLLTFFV